MSRFLRGPWKGSPRGFGSGRVPDHTHDSSGTVFTCSVGGFTGKSFSGDVRVSHGRRTGSPTLRFPLFRVGPRGSGGSREVVTVYGRSSSVLVVSGAKDLTLHKSSHTFSTVRKVVFYQGV